MGLAGLQRENATKENNVYLVPKIPLECDKKIARVEPSGDDGKQKKTRGLTDRIFHVAIGNLSLLKHVSKRQNGRYVRHVSI